MLLPDKFVQIGKLQHARVKLPITTWVTNEPRCMVGLIGSEKSTREKQYQYPGLSSNSLEQPTASSRGLQWSSTDPSHWNDVQRKPSESFASGIRRKTWGRFHSSPCVTATYVSMWIQVFLQVSSILLVWWYHVPKHAGAVPKVTSALPWVQCNPWCFPSRDTTNFGLLRFMDKSIMLTCQCQFLLTLRGPLGGIWVGLMHHFKVYVV